MRFLKYFICISLLITSCAYKEKTETNANIDVRLYNNSNTSCHIWVGEQEWSPTELIDAGCYVDTTVFMSVNLYWINDGIYWDGMDFSYNVSN